MKLVELLLNQEIIVQLNWGEQKIEFVSKVLEKDDTAVYVTPYIHNGNELELNVTPDKGVICNVFADNKNSSQRVSWKNVELTTVARGGRVTYYIKTRGFNVIASPDDRRLHERVAVNTDGTVFDGDSAEGVNIIVRDISDIGIAFYSPVTFIPKSQQVTVRFTDSIDNRSFNVTVEGTITRTVSENGRNIIGCKVLGENKDYKLYGLMKRLKAKSSRYTASAEGGVSGSESEGKDGTAPQDGTAEE